MSLESGARIGPYEVVGKLGEGGMGEVYRARDPRLRREVAIKVLPALLSSDPERQTRFEREAQALAALNHPHIAAIYGFEDLGGVRSLVMELVEGPTLGDRIGQGPVPIAESLRFGKQIASALDAAHEKGIIHRDLKPANIKLSADGDVKVLDFGLAKMMEGDGSRLREQDPSPYLAAGVSNSPTLTARATQLGIILGTGAYMAPEQARGKAVDKRVDIWGFGCVLYELLTGKRAFEGEEITDVLARVIERDPNWSRLPASTPPALRKLLERCLAKDPKARLRDIGEARFILDEIDAAKSATESATTPAAPTAPADRSGSRLARLAPWAVAGSAVIAAVAMALKPPPAPVPGEQTRLELAIPNDVELFQRPNISTNGRVIVFIGVREGVRQVYVRRLDRAETRAMPGTEGASYVDVAPDGRTGAMIGTDTRLKRLSFETDMIEPVLIGSDILAGLCVTGDGTVVFIQGTKLMALPAGGTATRVLASLDSAAGELAFGWPVATAGGANVLFSTRYGKPGQMRTRVEMVPLSGGTRRVVTENAEQALVALASRIVVVQDGAMLVSDFDERGARLIGPSTRIKEDVLITGTGAMAAAISHQGTIVFAGSSLVSAHLAWVDASGAEHVIPGPARVYQNPRVSPDGRQIAFAANGTIWTLDPVRGGVTRVSPDSGDKTMGFPVWSADSTRLFYRTRDGIAEQRADGEGASRAFKGTGPADYPSSVTPDGKTLVFLRITAETAGDILSAPIAGGDPKPLLVTPAYEGAPQVSPDGKWLAYVSNHSSQMEVYLRPLDGGDRRWPVSNGGGLHPLWSHDGRQIYYRSGQKLMAVDVTVSPDVRLGTPRLLHERRYEFGVNLTFPNYSLSHDGRQFLMVKGDDDSSHFNLVLNWLR